MRTSVSFRTIAFEDAALRSGIQRLIGAFSDTSDNLEIDALSGIKTEVAGWEIALRIESEASKLGPLLADLALIEAYARNAGAAATAIATMSDALRAARDKHDGEGAVESIVYALRGLRSRSEIMADVTAYGTTAGIDPSYATSRVLAIVPDLTASQVALLQNAPPAERRSLATSRYFAGPGRRFSLISTMSTGAERRMIVELTTSGMPLALTGVF